MKCKQTSFSKVQCQKIVMKICPQFNWASIVTHLVYNNYQISHFVNCQDSMYLYTANISYVQHSYLKSMCYAVLITNCSCIYNLQHSELSTTKFSLCYWIDLLLIAVPHVHYSLLHDCVFVVQANLHINTKRNQQKTVRILIMAKVTHPCFVSKKFPHFKFFRYC